ncbi:MAG: Trk system potassium transporter TrkA [Deltaproteobacteria bacterium]|nr:Trk system potassium transporter TrkA [Deltaproteobacteria bacterium]
MRVMIVGGGEIGGFLAERFVAEGMDVTVLDQDPVVVANLAQRVDAACVQGNGASVRDLTKARVKSMDLFISATQLDDANLISCLLAHQMGVPQKIAVTRKMDSKTIRYRFDHRKIGIDTVINLSEAVTSEMMEALDTSGVSEVASFAGGKIKLIGQELDSTSDLVGRAAERLSGGDDDYFLAAVIREQIPLPPENLILAPGDYLYLLAVKEKIPAVYKLLNVEEIKHRTAVICGNGQLTEQLVTALLDRYFQVTVVVDTPHQMESLRHQFHNRPHLKVKHGPMLDLKTLRHAGVPNTSLFISVSEEDTVNMTACMGAKHMGAGKTMAAIKRNDFLAVWQDMGLDVAVAPRLAAAKLVQKAVHGESLVNYRAMAQANLEVVELELKEGAKAVGKSLEKLRLPEGVVIGGVVSDGKVSFPGAGSVLQSGDRVIVMTPPEYLLDMEKLFVG